MKKYQNLFFSKKSQKASGRPLEASEGLGKASRRFSRMGADTQKIEKVLKECFAQHVDGAPSTAPSKISGVQRLMVRSTLSVNFFDLKTRPAGEK